MAHLISCNAIPKLARFGVSLAKSGSWGSVALLAAGRRSIQSGPTHGPASATPMGQAKEAAQQGVEELIKGGENITNKATNAAENVSQKATYVADNTAATKQRLSETIREEAGSMAEDAVGTAQEVSDRARQAVRDVWGSAKDTAQKAKDTVLGKD